LALAAILAGASGAAHATEGWYGRADVGWSFEGEADFGPSPGFGGWGDATMDHDLSEHLGLGYAFQNGFRLEGELGHRFNQLDGPGVFGHAFDEGDVHAWSAMANLFYDFNRGGQLEPYIGVGVGAARVNVGCTDNIPPAWFVDGEDTVFAYQGMVGFAVGLGQQWDLDIGYRYFKADGVEYDSIQGATTLTGEMDYEHQAVTVGLRYQFAAPAPAPVVTPPVVPPPPPPPVVQPACPTSEFVVYFEWDRSNLNQAALETIDAAVNRARQCNVSGTIVVGHTDTSGSTAYNQGLSERRASVVRDALVARGMAAGSIQTQARGEGDLARPTRDGVREPLNRRTAVTISFR
jgi:outer membrane protein OmpA-like peptidoglycan-associated protein